MTRPKVSWENIAASAYRAYSESRGGRNYIGEPIPSWAAVPEHIKTAWQCAVRQAVSVADGGSFGLDIEMKWRGWHQASCSQEELDGGHV